MPCRAELRCAAPGCGKPRVALVFGASHKDMLFFGAPHRGAPSSGAPHSEALISARCPGRAVFRRAAHASEVYRRVEQGSGTRRSRTGPCRLGTPHHDALSSTRHTARRFPSAPSTATPMSQRPAQPRNELSYGAPHRDALYSSAAIRPHPPGGIKARARGRPSPRPSRTILPRRLPTPTGPVVLVVDVRRPRAYQLLPMLAQRLLRRSPGSSPRPHPRRLAVCFAACIFTGFIHATTRRARRVVFTGARSCLCNAAR